MFSIVLATLASLNLSVVLGLLSWGERWLCSLSCFEERWLWIDLMELVCTLFCGSFETFWGWILFKLIWKGDFGFLGESSFCPDLNSKLWEVWFWVEPGVTITLNSSRLFLSKVLLRVLGIFLGLNRSSLECVFYPSSFLSRLSPREVSLSWYLIVLSFLFTTFLLELGFVLLFGSLGLILSKGTCIYWCILLLSLCSSIFSPWERLKCS